MLLRLVSRRSGAEHCPALSGGEETFLLQAESEILRDRGQIPSRQIASLIRGQSLVLDGPLEEGFGHRVQTGLGVHVGDS